MGETAQQRAVRTYRSRLRRRGMARVEIVARNADRDLIRALAKRLAGDSPDAAEIRAAVSRIHRWSAPISCSAVRKNLGVDV